MGKMHNIIEAKTSVKKALELFNKLAPEAILQTTLFVVDSKKHLLGVLTEGDIRRSLLKGIDLTESVSVCMNKNFKFFNEQNFKASLINELKEKKIRFVPFLDKQKKVIRIYDLETIKSILPLDVVIMCGGKGERLRPLTADVPKPMLHVGNKPIMEHTIDRLAQYGVQNFYLSVNYLKEKIEQHFGEGETKGIKVNYIHEKNPLGTIGSVRLVKKFSNEYVLVQNGDLITNIDYEAFYQQALQSKAAITIATVPYSVDVPFAILDLNKHKKVKALHEKPRYTYEANAGIYLLHQSILNLIPQQQFFNATDLIQLAIDNKENVSTFPIIGYWTDVGRMEDFVKEQHDIQKVF